MCPFNGNENEEIHLLDYLKIIQKRKWIVIICFVVVVVFITIKTFKTTPVFQATSSIVLERKEINVGFQQVVTENQMAPMDFYTNQCEIIKSRSIAKKVIDALGLKNHPEFTPQKKRKDTSPAKDISQDPFAETRFINGFLSKLNVSLMRNSGVVNIKYNGHDPQLVTKIANSIVQTYIEQNWERRYNVAKDALNWLNKQIKDVKISLEESEQALQKYKKANDLIAVDMGESVKSSTMGGERQNVVLQKLMDLNSELTNAKIDSLRLELLHNKFKEFKDTHDDELIQSIPAVTQNTLIQALKTKYVDTEREYFLKSQRYGVKHPEMIKLSVELNTTKDNILKEAAQISDSIATEYEIAKSRETTLLTAVEQQKGEIFALGDKAIYYAVLKREVDTNRQMYETLLTRMKETNLTEELKSSDIRVLDYAEVPISPIKPNKRMNILLGIIVGLGCGVGIAFLMEYMDNTIKTQEDIEKYLGTPLLGIVGHIPMEKKESLIPQLITHTLPKHAISEAVKGIRTSIMFSHPDNPKKILLITSALPAEGKSTFASNLAVTMAQTGKKVLLIDADLRKPSLHKLFQIDKSTGLSNILVKSCDLRMASKATQVPNVFVVACGPLPPNPSELLSSPAMAECLHAAKEVYDWIIIDSPPLLTVTDARILARVVDGIIFVLKSNTTTRDAARKAESYLSDIRDKLLGAVINDVDFARNKYYYQYYYQYYYGERASEETQA